MDARKNLYHSRRLSGRRVCDASRTAFLTHSSERHGSPREERLCASPSLSQLGWSKLQPAACPYTPSPSNLYRALCIQNELLKYCITSSPWATNLTTGMVSIYRMSNIAITNFNITHSHTYLACSHLLAFYIQARSVYPQQTVQYNM